jgi:hypothetical protein
MLHFPSQCLLIKFNISMTAHQFEIFELPCLLLYEAQSAYPEMPPSNAVAHA